jgi:hypothetical protein
VETTDSAWQEMEFDIHSIADGHEDVRIRFTMRADNSWQYAGWNIDDLEVLGDH